MSKKHFKLNARVSTDSPTAIRAALDRLFVKGTVKGRESPGEFLVEAEVDGDSARDLNRLLLSALRKVEKKTRLRAEWTSGGTTERFFDYVPKGIRRSGDRLSK
jgi:hypothetical protein